MMPSAFAIPAVVSISLSTVLSGCGQGGTTTTAHPTFSGTTTAGPHIKWWKKEVHHNYGGQGVSVGADGTVFFVSNEHQWIPNPDPNHKPGDNYVPNDMLSALDGNDGTLKWQYKLRTDRTDTFPDSRHAKARPVAGLDGSVYLLESIGAGGATPIGSDAVLAVRGDGIRKWIHRFDTNDFHTEICPYWDYGEGLALGSNDTVLVSLCHYTHSMPNHTLLALDGSDGAIKWQNSVGEYQFRSPIVAPDNTIFLSDNGGGVFALQGSDGALKWNVSLNNVTDPWSHRNLSPPSMGANGTILVCSAGDRLYALDGKDGSVKWQQQAACVQGTKGSTSDGPTVGSDGTIFVQSSPSFSEASSSCRAPSSWDYGSPLCSNLLALNGDDGSIKWSYEVRHTELSWWAKDSIFSKDADFQSFTTPAVSADGTVYAGLGMSLYALDADTGDLRWISSSWTVETINDFQLDQQNFPPVIGPDGTVFVSATASLFAYHGDYAGPATAPYSLGHTQAVYLV